MTTLSHAAMDAAERARRDAPVATVGSKTITAGELETRLAAVPRFQLSAFGDTPDVIRHRFLNEVLVPDALLAMGAEAQHMDRDPQAQGGITRALANATVRALRTANGSAKDISMEDVNRFYTANKARYDTPDRYQVWRILCRTREEAVAVILAAKKDLTVQTWSALARDHSIDEATNQRGGNLGFLSLDGSSNEAGVRADPAVVKAAAAVKDAEIVPNPVAEGPNFAIVWHKTTVPAMHRTVDDVAAQIRDTLWKQRDEQSVRKLVADLRARDLKELNEGLLNGIEVSVSDGEIVPRHRPGQVPPLVAIRAIPR